MLDLDRECFYPAAKRSVRTDRGFRYYLKAFNYGQNGQELEGKIILDIGEGDSDFADVCRERGLARVIALDHSYYHNPPKTNKDKVSSLGQELPFGDETFDEVIASYSLWWINRGLAGAIREMLRVVKNGGKVKIHPAIVKPGVDEGLFRMHSPFHASSFFGLEESCDSTLVLTKPADLADEDSENGLDELLQSFRFTLGRLLVTTPEEISVGTISMPTEITGFKKINLSPNINYKYQSKLNYLTKIKGESSG